MGAWAKLASRAAFRKGQASYCGYINAVRPGMWSGGVVGLKSILGSRSRAQSLEALSKLSELGYVRCSLNAKTKKLTYQITDWVLECSGEECMNGSVYESHAITAAELLPGDLGFLMDADGQGWNHVLIFAGYGENGERMWVHSSGGEGVILNTPSYEASLSLRRPNEVDFDD